MPVMYVKYMRCCMHMLFLLGGIPAINCPEAKQADGKQDILPRRV